jgi:hypothetical protein
MPSKDQKKAAKKKKDKEEGPSDFLEVITQSPSKHTHPSLPLISN